MVNLKVEASSRCYQLLSHLHSNMVNLKESIKMEFLQKNIHLHSNMVNLKAERDTTLLSSIDAFTFQYG